MNIRAVIRLLRPHQWVKNGFVFLPMFFSGRLFDMYCWQQALMCFAAYALMSSAIYCLNDLCDIEADRKHPRKRTRPLASGEVSVRSAVVMMALLAVGSVMVCALGMDSGRRWGVMSVIGGYLLLNVAYCFWLKRLAIIDVFIVSSGFVLRLTAGGLACAVWLSPWIVCLTFLLSLFLAFAKRRDDVVIRESQGLITRANIIGYNLQFMNQTLGIIAAVTIVCYIMYTVSPDVVSRLGSRYLYATSVFVLAGILRYLQVAIVDLNCGSPTKVLLKDRFLQGCFVCWILLFVVIIYL